MRKTTIIAIEGIDGSGKSVQFQKLHEWLLSRGLTVKTMEFPVYDSFFGAHIGRLLTGADGIAANEVDAKSMALWFAMDRWDQFRDYQDDVYDVLLINRYILSNAVYQSIRERDLGMPDIVDWVFDLEYNHLHLPEPNIHLLFDMAVDQAESNVRRKGHREYVGDGRDVYESSHGIQWRAREKYLECANRFDAIAVVSCMSEGILLPPDMIAEKVRDVLSARKIIPAGK